MTMTTTPARASLLAGLIVLSAVAGSWAVGLAAGGSVSKTVDASNAEYVAVDISEVTGIFRVKVWVEPRPGGGTRLVYNETHTAANIGTDTPAYRNAKAYQNVTIEISGNGVPSDVDIGTGDEFNRITWTNPDILSASGGDRDFICNPHENIALIIHPRLAIDDCRPLPGTTAIGNLSDLDRNETRLEIYQSAAAEAQAADNYHAIVNNYLQDSLTTALLHGKSAYIRSLNQGDSEITAQTEATENITEYYSRLEYNLIQRWNSQISHAEYLQELARSAGAGEYYVNATLNTREDSPVNWARVQYYGETGYTLQNGTTIQARTYTVNTSIDRPSGNTKYYHYTATPTSGKLLQNISNSGPPRVTGIGVAPPTDRYDYLPAVTNQEYADHLAEIENQTVDANDQMDTVINATYEEYTAGEINESDIVDPYVLQNQYSPGSEYQGWATAQLSLLGVDQPDNYSQTGFHNVTLSDGTTLRGIIHSAENPPSGQFAVNETYNPANITGSQYLVTDSDIRTLDENFTINSIQTRDGQTVQNFTVVNKTYETTDSEDIEALYDEIAEMRAEIEARENAFAGGGGGLLGGDLSENQRIAVIIGVALLGYGLLRD